MSYDQAYAQDFKVQNSLTGSPSLFPPIPSLSSISIEVDEFVMDTLDLKKILMQGKGKQEVAWLSWTGMWNLEDKEHA